MTENLPNLAKDRNLQILETNVAQIAQPKEIYADTS